MAAMAAPPGQIAAPSPDLPFTSAFVRRTASLPLTVNHGILTASTYLSADLAVDHGSLSLPIRRPHPSDPAPPPASALLTIQLADCSLSIHLRRP